MSMGTIIGLVVGSVGGCLILLGLLLMTSMHWAGSRHRTLLGKVVAPGPGPDTTLVRLRLAVRALTLCPISMHMITKQEQNRQVCHHHHQHHHRRQTNTINFSCCRTCLPPAAHHRHSGQHAAVGHTQPRYVGALISDCIHNSCCW
jgi:hypothetical protein